MEFHPENLRPIHYLPILTTLFSAFFFARIFGRFMQKGGLHLFWWAAGVFTYGLGTLLESLITLFGNGPMMNKLWYAAGAILGGYPLAQGSVYLHLPKRTANILTTVTFSVIVAAIVLVLLSPVNTAVMESFRPSGAALGWQWLRLVTPFINTYSVIFLIGTALWSAVRYSRIENGKYRAIGNALITIGAVLPGVGGATAKAGFVEALYIGEFVGILLIYAGYRVCLISPAIAAPAAPGINPPDPAI